MISLHFVVSLFSFLSCTQTLVGIDIGESTIFGTVSFDGSFPALIPLSTGKSPAQSLCHCQEANVVFGTSAFEKKQKSPHFSSTPLQLLNNSLEITQSCIYPPAVLLSNQLQWVASSVTTPTSTPSVVLSIPPHSSSSLRSTLTSLVSVSGFQTAGLVETDIALVSAFQSEPSRTLQPYLSPGPTLDEAHFFIICEVGASHTNLILVKIGVWGREKEWNVQSEILASLYTKEFSSQMLTDAVTEYFRQQVQSKIGRSTITSDLFNTLLQIEADKAKCLLTVAPSFHSSLETDTVPQVDIPLTISQLDFERLISSHIRVFNKEITLFKHDMENILSKDEEFRRIDGIVLCGGGVRTPSIQSAISSVFKAPIVQTLNLDEAVSIGTIAHIQALQKYQNRDTTPDRTGWVIHPSIRSEQEHKGNVLSVFAQMPNGNLQTVSFPLENSNCYNDHYNLLFSIPFSSFSSGGRGSTLKHYVNERRHLPRGDITSNQDLPQSISVVVHHYDSKDSSKSTILSSLHVADIDRQSGVLFSRSSKPYLSFSLHLDEDHSYSFGNVKMAMSAKSDDPSDPIFLHSFGDTFPSYESSDSYQPPFSLNFGVSHTVHQLKSSSTLPQSIVSRLPDSLSFPSASTFTVLTESDLTYISSILAKQADSEASMERIYEKRHQFESFVFDAKDKLGLRNSASSGEHGCLNARELEYLVQFVQSVEEWLDESLDTVRTEEEWEKTESLTKTTLGPFLKKCEVIR
ncbi:hypothetical protein BLNAU_21774 [Blattamonas nauphoetae]|uniref:Actin-like ATPase domain-containing protein n=1 Tax=Blattamonas nauphoetae TaxID=2049346 RepID=A0ABQ9WUY9_9EUKA|nr:hypothetical protein BLNAU_21774 [Blattamonas nauphoetae]